MCTVKELCRGIVLRIVLPVVLLIVIVAVLNLGHELHWWNLDKSSANRRTIEIRMTEDPAMLAIKEKMERQRRIEEMFRNELRRGNIYPNYNIQLRRERRSLRRSELQPPRPLPFNAEEGSFIEPAKSSVNNGLLIRTKGKGAFGSFKLALLKSKVLRK